MNDEETWSKTAARVVGGTVWLVALAGCGVSNELLRCDASFALPATACTERGVCLGRCPFDVDVLTKLRGAASLFELQAAYPT